LFHSGYESTLPNAYAGGCGLSYNVSLRTCPVNDAAVACYGHGVCDTGATETCSCFDGWEGPTCSLRSCPKGPAWFDLPVDATTAHLPVECSNMGICNHITGLCICRAGWEGEACEKLSCRAFGEQVPCSGHGQCLSLREMGRKAKVNGVPTPVTYGSVANAVNTWDADSVKGCLCDEGYTGYNCAHKICPSGDDPMTTGDVHEKQRMSCYVSSGSTFTLTFRDEETEAINADDTISTLKSKLEALTSIDVVVLTDGGGYSGSTICNHCPGKETIITFVTELGNLPLLQSSSSDVYISEMQTGTKENIECSRRGLCDEQAGRCTCFSGFGSSDGNENLGSRGDCGAFLSPTDRADPNPRPDVVTASPTPAPTASPTACPVTAEPTAYPTPVPTIS